MKKSEEIFALILLAVSTLGLLGCTHDNTDRKANPMVGTWVEVIADRASHKFTGRTEISYNVKVKADTFAGTISATSYDAAGTLTEGPTSPTPLEGKRVTLP